MLGKLSIFEICKGELDDLSSIDQNQDNTNMTEQRASIYTVYVVKLNKIYKILKVMHKYFPLYQELTKKDITYPKTRLSKACT